MKVEIGLELDAMKQALPIAARMLNSSSENIEVYTNDRYFSQSFYTHSDLKDKCIARSNINDYPNIHILGNNCNSNMLGYGLFLYQVRNQPELKYVFLFLQEQHKPSVNAFFIKKGEVFRVVRHFKKMNKMNNSDMSPPVLHDNILDNVLNNTISLFEKSKKLIQRKIKISRGLIFAGSPGNGKTYTCKYIKKLADDNSLLYKILSPNDIEEGYSNNKLLELFCYPIVFIDDIELSHLNRKEGKGSLACSLLSILDGMHTAEGYGVRVIILSTNESLNFIDPAFLRPGRIDCVFHFDNPTKLLRKKFIGQWEKDILDYLIKTDQLDYLVNETKNCSFAEMKYIQSIMIVNNIINNKPYDLGSALEEFRYNRDQKNQENDDTKSGFMSEVKQYLVESKV